MTAPQGTKQPHDRCNGQPVPRGKWPQGFWPLRDEHGRTFAERKAEKEPNHAPLS